MSGTSTAHRPPTEPTSPPRSRGLLFYGLLTLVGLGALAYAVVEHIDRPGRLIKAEREAARRNTHEIASSIGDEAAVVLSRVRELREILACKSPSSAEIDSFVRTALKASPLLHGVGICYEPANGVLASPYWSYGTAGIETSRIEDAYDYTALDPGPEIFQTDWDLDVLDRADDAACRTEWYHQPHDLGAAWVEPYFGAVAQQTILTYGERVDTESPVTDGAVVYADFSLQRLRGHLSRFPIALTGYAFLVSEAGFLITHPTSEFGGRSLASVPEDQVVLHRLRDLASEGDTFLLHASQSGRDNRVFVERVPNTPWTLVTVYDEKEIVATHDAERRSRIYILLCGIVAIMGLSGLLIPCRSPRTRNWLMAILLSGSLLIGIGCVWNWSLKYPAVEGAIDYPVYDKCTAHAVLARLLPSGRMGDERAMPTQEAPIPTGVFVQSAQFLGSYNVEVTGYLWQRFDSVEDAEEAHGVIFPEAEDPRIDLAFTSGTTACWYFEANLRQAFDYATYPIDHERVWLRIWPADFIQGTRLIPDFDAYDSTDSSDKPGLEEEFVLEGWDCCASFFSYRTHDYGVSFGAQDYIAHNNRPELYFNIDLQRRFIGPFISDLMPMMVVAILLFAILMIQTRRDESGLLGFSASTVLSYCSGLFFVLIISHVYVREKLAVPQIIYIDWFYFTMYALLLLLSMNAVWFARGRRAGVFGLEETDWITLAYWPLALGILFLMTLITFF